ncbi:MAG: hypothetical protein M3R04_04005 [bacterium]|nr:hypothetical protein [bacterium]
MPTSYELISGVQDLYAQFQNLRAAQPQVYADTLVKGVATLLGAHQPAATTPLLLALSGEVEELYRRYKRPLPQDAKLARKELQAGRVGDESQAYRLFGEMLGAYIAVLTRS